MATGVCKWFNVEKGYGFIEPHNGGGDVFIHVRSLQKTGISSLSPGDRVSYDLVEHKGRTSAGNVSIVG